MPAAMWPSASSSSSETSKQSNSAPPFLHSAARSFHSLTSNILSRLPFPPVNPTSMAGTAACPTSSSSVTLPLLLPFYAPSYNHNQIQGPPLQSSPVRSLSSSMRVEGLSSSSKGGPAFVGQVFSMLDPSGNGLMAVTSHFDIPFLSERTPDWLKRMLAMVTKSDHNGPVFRFFMDLSDSVAYVKRLNIPTGKVGACRLDVAYEHFKDKPHMFQFVPNGKQVKAANELLKRIPQKGGRGKVDGVPVFTAQNLNIAIATTNGIKWYTPYFFDKGLLDNILEGSIDQHFHTLIQNRHVQRRRDIIDDSLTAEVMDETADGLFDPPEVKEVLDEIGHLDIPLSVISKAAEIKLLDTADKVLLGNKWLRKATGIQPKFPYLVDSFEARSAAAYLKDAVSVSSVTADNNQPELQCTGASELNVNDNGFQSDGQTTYHTDFRFPFGDWFSKPWSRLHDKQQKLDQRVSGLYGGDINEAPPNPLLPKITMVGVSMGEGGRVSKSHLKKTMDDLTRELEQASRKSSSFNEDNDPLFVANVGDYSSITRMNN